MPQRHVILELAGWGVLLALLVAAPWLVNPSFVFLMIDFLIMALFATSYNLLLGQTGMLSFGHAAYYGIGAYTVALLSNRLGVDIVVGLLLAPLVAGSVGLVIGFFCVRLSGFYFAILTMAFAQLVWSVAFGWYSFTGGDDGLPVSPPDYMLAPTGYFYFALAFVAVSIALLRLISGSPFGAALAAIRENPDRAAFVGINVRAYRLAAFTLAAAFAGIAGGLRVPLQLMAYPLLLYWTQSAEPVLMTLIGGMQAFVGPIVGAAVFVFLNFTITGYTQYSLLFFGTLVVFLVLVLPGGIVGFLQAIFRNQQKRLLGMADLRDKSVPPRRADGTHAGSD
jgi:branched-chain amino acid transport system permease protein